MGAELIPLLQMGIWLIVAIMVGMVALYFGLMRSHNITYTSNNDKFTQEYNKNEYDDGINNKEENEEPIQHL